MDLTAACRFNRKAGLYRSLKKKKQKDFARGVMGAWLPPGFYRQNFFQEKTRFLCVVPHGYGACRSVRVKFARKVPAGIEAGH